MYFTKLWNDHQPSTEQLRLLYIPTSNEEALSHNRAEIVARYCDFLNNVYR